MSLKIIKNRKFDIDMRSIWNALSTNEALNDWFLSGNFKPETGARFEFNKGKKKISGEILSSQAPINLAMSWEIRNTEYITYVWWRLDERKGQTKLELEHSGFKGLHGFIQTIRYNRFWNRKIKSLRKYLETR